MFFISFYYLNQGYILVKFQSYSSYSIPWLLITSVDSKSQRPISRTIFHRNSNSMEIPFCCHPSCSEEVIAMKFWTWHDSCAVMSCAKLCSNMIHCNGVTQKPIFHRIWTTMEKSFMKWAPSHQQLWCWPSNHRIFQFNSLTPGRFQFNFR